MMAPTEAGGPVSIEPYPPTVTLTVVRADAATNTWQFELGADAPASDAALIEDLVCTFVGDGADPSRFELTRDGTQQNPVWTLTEQGSRGGGVMSPQRQPVTVTVYVNGEPQGSRELGLMSRPELERHLDGEPYPWRQTSSPDVYTADLGGGDHIEYWLG
jgi:hypothetical protein